MDKILLYPIGSSESCGYASAFLQQAGFSVTDHPSPDVTHLLLDVPHSGSSGPEDLLCMLPEKITVIGGNLEQAFLKGYRKIDLLKDSYYLAKNAAITAECALRAAGPHLKTTFADSPALILGWGRIGKCLSQLLRCHGCDVTVAARKESDLAMLEALGYRAVDFSEVSAILRRYRILFNTVPDLPLNGDIVDAWSTGIAIDLASLPGMSGKRVIPARGLPGRFVPETSGRLIADTIVSYYKEGIL